MPRSRELSSRQRKEVRRAILRWSRIVEHYAFLSTSAPRASALPKQRELELIVYEYITTRAVSALDSWLDKKYAVKDLWMNPGAARDVLTLWLRCGREVARLRSDEDAWHDVENLAFMLGVPSDLIVAVLSDDEFKTVPTQRERTKGSAGTVLVDEFLERLGLPSRRQRIRDRKPFRERHAMPRK